jgi:hypothetical protein
MQTIFMTTPGAVAAARQPFDENSLVLNYSRGKVEDKIKYRRQGHDLTTSARHATDELSANALPDREYGPP